MNDTMTTPIHMTSQYRDLTEFLVKHNAKNDVANLGTPAHTHTHTRIGDKTLNIFGGSYIIPKEDLPIFYKLYYDHVFIRKKQEYLTERQLKTCGPLLVDFDFRYNYDVETRQHTKEHIQDMLLVYLEELKDFFAFEENKPFSIFIMEKPNVNRLADKSLTKDGIHMIVGLQMCNVMQVMLRDRMLAKLAEVWDIPIINTWDSVLDEGISKGTTNWQLYGSRKPTNEAYELTQHFVITFDPTDGEFMMEEQRIHEFNMEQNLCKLSAQYEDHPRFEHNPKITSEYNARLGNTKSLLKKSTSKTKIKLIDNGSEGDDDDSDNEDIPLDEITNQEILKKAVDIMLNNLKTAEYELRTIHEIAQVLPEQYYRPGSHEKNTQVAFALKHTDDRLFLSWVMLRSKAADFSFDTIPQLYQRWRQFKARPDGITARSIMYWAKQDAYDEFQRVRKSSIDYYIEQTMVTPTDYDFAYVLYEMFKDKYICVGSEHKVWYVFRNHRWVPDKGCSLRLAISKDMFNAYHDKAQGLIIEMQQFEAGDERYDSLKRRINRLSVISLSFKKSSDKNNILREATDLFYDEYFTKNMDANRYLMCFTNGVMDFKTNKFRSGYPQDYITKSTNIPYIEYEETQHNQIGNDIITFMEQLFPVASLNKYMWDHLASVLIGININQTFNIYLGSGSNGKSLLTDLMSHALGEYKGTVPITLVTEKRNSIGGTSSEVMQLKGIRYAVMQEPTKNSRINEGVMKELTGGDPIQARALYAESETFMPQFKLVVCTNTLFEVDSNDDGTWRRIRLCQFMSKFVDPGEAQSINDDTPYKFPKDKTLSEKLSMWAPVFMSMLVKRVAVTHGHVEDCEVVMSSSNKYRFGQDHIAGFISERIAKNSPVKVESEKPIKRQELMGQFKIWFQEAQGQRKMPKGVELYEYMDKKFGKCGKDMAWHGVHIIYPNNQQDESAELLAESETC